MRKEKTIAASLHGQNPLLDKAIETAYFPLHAKYTGLLARLALGAKAGDSRLAAYEKNRNPFWPGTQFSAGVR
jgi:hypothetical protein